QQFHELARTEHPDAGGGNFEQLNVAYRTLADPKSRLAHLLELTGGKPPTISQPPADLVDLFFATATALQAPNTTIEDHLVRLTNVRNQIVEGLRAVDCG